MKTLNIYIHIPFCFAKCPYCAFYSCVQSENMYEKYFKRLEEEILEKSKQYSEREVETIYIGGGTPNLVPSEYISRTIGKIKEMFKVKSSAEISIELYPQYIAKENLKEYKEIGVNRVSLGLQTVDNTLLKQLTRRYTYEEFLEKYSLVKEYTFENIGVDLIFGFPNHTLEVWKDTLERVCELDIQHISAYSLEIEESSVYGKLNERGKLSLPSEEENREMYHYAVEYLNKRGFEQYEISNFSKKGYECNHNLNFWHYHDYLGFGAVAYSRIDNRKFNNPESLEEYFNKKSSEYEEISPNQQELEKKILGLRLNEGIEYEKDIFNKEYMDKDRDRMFLNAKGKDFYNIVIENLL